MWPGEEALRVGTAHEVFAFVVLNSTYKQQSRLPLKIQLVAGELAAGHSGKLKPCTFEGSFLDILGFLPGCLVAMETPVFNLVGTPPGMGGACITSSGQHESSCGTYSLFLFLFRIFNYSCQIIGRRDPKERRREGLWKDRPYCFVDVGQGLRSHEREERR